LLGHDEVVPGEQAGQEGLHPEPRTGLLGPAQPLDDDRRANAPHPLAVDLQRGVTGQQPHDDG